MSKARSLFVVTCPVSVARFINVMDLHSPGCQFAPSDSVVLLREFSLSQFSAGIPDNGSALLGIVGFVGDN